MKKVFSFIAALFLTSYAAAQTVNIHFTDGSVISYPTSLVDYVDYSTGTPVAAPELPDNLELIDLGLPSGTLWANLNIGAENPEDTGLYFAWGETRGYTNECYETGEWKGRPKDGRRFTWQYYAMVNGGYDSWSALTKYTIDDKMYDGSWYSKGMFIGDGKMILDPADDAACKLWGGGWHMPTYNQIYELVMFCTAEKALVNDVPGVKLTSKINGETIFFPFTGARHNWTFIYEGERGYYWSSSLSENRSDAGRSFHVLDMTTNLGAQLISGKISPENDLRCFGQCIRPVIDYAPVR